MFIAMSDDSFQTNDITNQPTVAGIAIYKFKG